MELQAGMEVLGEGLGADPANFLEGAAAEDSPRARPEGRIIAVPAGHYPFEEEVLLIGKDPLEEEVVLEGVGVIEMLLGLDKGHPGVAEKAHRLPEEALHRGMVGVKDDHQLPRGPGQGLIYIAGFGMAVVGPGEVATSQPVGELFNLG